MKVAMVQSKLHLQKTNTRLFPRSATYTSPLVPMHIPHSSSDLPVWESFPPNSWTSSPLNVYTIIVRDVGEVINKWLSLVAAMYSGVCLGLKLRLKLPSLVQAQTFLFPASTTYTRPSEPIAMPRGLSKRPDPLPLEPKADKNLPSSPWTVTRCLSRSQM